MALQRQGILINAENFFNNISSYTDFAFKLNELHKIEFMVLLQKLEIIPSYSLACNCENGRIGIFKTPNTTLGYSFECTVCGRDGYVYRCLNKSHRRRPSMMYLQNTNANAFGLRHICGICRSTRSILTGSYFANHSIDIKTILLVMFMWCTNASVNITKQVVEMSKRHVIQWFSHCRSICSTTLLPMEFVLGGEGRVVQIDESLFVKRKYHRGRLVREQWVFGMIDVFTKFVVLVLVPNRTRETLFAIIRQYVQPGTTIWSDSWRAYEGIDNENEYVHQKVNHSQNFIDPITGVHTQSIEGVWSRIKRWLRNKNTMKTNDMASYIDEFMWRQALARNSKTNEIIFKLLTHLSHWEEYSEFNNN